MASFSSPGVLYSWRTWPKKKASSPWMTEHFLIFIGCTVTNASAFSIHTPKAAKSRPTLMPNTLRRACGIGLPLKRASTNGIWSMTLPAKSSPAGRDPRDPRDPRRFWLHPMLKVVHRTDAEIKRLLGKAAEAAASDVERLARGGESGLIRRGQFTSAYQALRKTLRILFEDVGDTVKAGRTDAAEAAMVSAFEWEEPYYRAAGLSRSERARLRAATTATSDRNVELMLRRFNTEQIPLSQQVYRTRQLASGWVDKVVNLGLGRGLTAREIAKEVRSSIRPDVRGGVSYAAMRLGRTEINNSFHTAAILSSVDKPWVEGQQWHLSGSHIVPDKCDKFAKEDQFGLGEGVFPRDQVPRKPHPQCFCYLAPALQDEDEFVAAFARGSYDNYFDQAG